MSSRKPFRKKKKKTLIEKLDMNMTTKDYMQWKKKFWIKSDPGKEFISEYCLCYPMYKEKSASQWKKIIKGE